MRRKITVITTALVMTLAMAVPAFAGAPKGAGRARQAGWTPWASRHRTSPELFQTGGVSVVVPGIGVVPATWCDGI